MAANRREAILEGASAAASVHERFGLRTSLRDGQAPIDVFDILFKLDIPAVCRPLDGLLGVFLPRPLAGIIVTTQRSHHVQRYTAAHELGHFVLEHSASLDDDSCIGFVARGGTHRDLQEVAADAFASEMLAPQWLIAAVVDRQGWTVKQLLDPGVVYQLSLRLGLSYVATCWALAEHKAIPRRDAGRLASIPPKQPKRSALGNAQLRDPWADVWSVNERDHGAVLMGSPNDVVRLELPERGASGCSWDVDPAVRSGFTIVDDERVTGGADAIGSGGGRRLSLQGAGHGSFRLEERRLWDVSAEPVGTFELHFSLLGKEVGKPRASRRRYH